MTTLRATDLILAARDGDPTSIITEFDGWDAKDRAYIQAMVKWCDKAGIDPFIALTQWLVETANGESVRWNNDLNPGGVGIPADSTVQPFTIKDGDEAARIHVQALYAAVTHRLLVSIPLPEASHEWFSEIWLPKVNNRNYPGVTTVDDLNTRYTANGDAHATWAWDAEYVTTLISRCSAFYPDLHEQSSFTTPVEPPAGGTPVPETPLTFGKVPHPDYHDRPISKPDGMGQDNLGKRSVIGVTYHRMLGSLNGTDTYFRMATTGALTDYGMGVQDTDGTALDAVVYRWNNPLGYQSGWASGKVIAPWGDGLAFVNKYGANAVNKLRASIEISGNYDTPITDAVKQRIAEISAYWADQCQIPWNVYPIRPEDGFSFVCWHQEFTGPQEKVCPGAVVMNATADIIERTAAILKQYQTQPVVIPPTPKPDKYAAPVTYTWLSQPDGKVHQVGSTRVLPLSLTYTTTRSTPRYQKGSKTSAKIGPNIPKNTKFKANDVFRSDEGITFVMTPHGSRVLASALTPRVAVTASGRISIRNDAEAEPEVISDNVEATA